MPNDVTQSSNPDGFDARDPSANRNAPIIKFSKAGKWTRDGEELSEVTEYMLVKREKLSVRWGVDSGPPLETIVIAPDADFSDIDALNDAAPQDQWREDLNGNLRGPWENQHVIYLLNWETMDAVRFPTSTIGGGQAAVDIATKIFNKRKLASSTNIYPIVRLSSRPMKTKKWGPIPKPHFEIVRWIKFGDDGTPATLPPPSTQPQLESFAAEQPALEKTAAPTEERKYTLSTGAPPAKSKPTAPKKTTKGARAISEPSLKQEMDDEIAF